MEFFCGHGHTHTACGILAIGPTGKPLASNFNILTDLAPNLVQNLISKAASLGF